MRVKIITLVVGSLGVVSKQFGNRLKETAITAEIIIIIIIIIIITVWSVFSEEILLNDYNAIT